MGSGSSRSSGYGGYGYGGNYGGYYGGYGGYGRGYDSDSYYRNRRGLRNRNWWGGRDDYWSGGDNYSRVSDRVVTPDRNDVETLRIEKVDVNKATNTKEHNTSEYDITRTNLLVRRGQAFSVNVDLNRPYNKQKDDLRLDLTFGTRANESDGTQADFKVSEKDETQKWGAWVASSSGNSIVLSIIAAADCPVGAWKFNIDVAKDAAGTPEVRRYRHPEPIYILFNPWCKHDTVYLHDQDLREEYVLKEDGYIWRGTDYSSSPMPWNYAQCEGNVFACCMYLLEGHMSDSLRGDPVQVSRAITQLVNSSDNSGILTGNWSGDYAGGTSPMAWNGSEAIFEEFWKTKRQVKFGQCWVFCGVTTTFCRAVGIPCRSITNFNSAHDTERNTTIDYITDEDGNDKSRDSIWNFHCWNDAWFARLDLQDSYGGWQAIDATPQERSGGVYACGPMPLAAIRNGDVDKNYDGRFIFAEVNGDKVKKILTKNGKYIVTAVDKSYVGKNMSTKKPGSREREVITLMYKHKEGSDEERAAVRRAKLYVDDPGEVEKPGDVVYKIDWEVNTFIGQDLNTTLIMRNTSGDRRTVDVQFAVYAMYYTGVRADRIFQEHAKNVVIQGNSEERVRISRTVEQYLGALTDHCNIQIVALCTVEETGHIFFDSTQQRFRKPHLAIDAPRRVKVGESMTVKVSFRNPLRMALTKCELSLEGSGLSHPKTYKKNNVSANDEYSDAFEITPYKSGYHDLIVAFHCEQIYAINGDQTIQVV